MNNRITIETIRSGQPRPYADSIREFIMTFEWTPYGKTEFVPRDKLLESIVKRFGKAEKFFYEKGEAGADWASPMLETFEKVGPGKWRFVIREAFTD